MSLTRKAGTTDMSVVIRIIDSVDGTPETGVTSATSGIDLEYRREGAAVVNITESDLSALTDAHADGGMLHIGAGYYRVDVPDAAVASGATGVLVTGNITGMVVLGEYIQLVAYDPFDTVRLGLTALPNAAADAAGGLPSNTALAIALGTADDAVMAAIAALNNLSAAQVNAEVVDALSVDTYAEPGQGAPPATASLATKVGYLAKAWRNRHTQTATEYALYADDGTTKDQEAAVSDDGTTFERGEVRTGA